MTYREPGREPCRECGRTAALLHELCEIVDFMHPQAFWHVGSNLSSDLRSWWTERKKEHPVRLIPFSWWHESSVSYVLNAIGEWVRR